MDYVPGNIIHAKNQRRFGSEAIRANKTTAQIAQVFGVHPTQVGGWKKQALAGLPDIFGNGREQVRQRADWSRLGLSRLIMRALTNRARRP
jgi:hypothetical protein